MAKIQHKTPEGFRRVRSDGRTFFRPSLDVHAVHAHFKRLVPPLIHFDPVRELAGHLKRGHRYFFSTDLESAFDSVTAERLQSALEWKDINLELMLRNKKFFFHEEGEGGLIQGAPCSQYLFETYCRFGGLDRDLMEYCGMDLVSPRFHYTRYVDDILISSPQWLGKSVGPRVRGIVKRYGFVLNDAKTKRVDVNRTPLHVLGVVILGKRLEAPSALTQKLHEIDRSEDSHSGVLGRSRHIRRAHLRKNKKKKRGNI